VKALPIKFSKDFPFGNTVKRTTDATITAGIDIK